jgi:predicted component of type VI protein secretion system
MKHDADKKEQQEEVRVDNFTKLMFGPIPPHHNVKERKEQKSTEGNLQQIDYAQLMRQIDEIMNSLNQLKPIFRKLSPLLKYLKK